jgi:hypothetical protein
MSLSRLLYAWRWLRAPALGHVQVTLYTRRGCHLCEQAWGQLQAARARYGFTLTATDVDADPKLRAQYDDCVPVVMVNGKVRFRGQVNPLLLERLLRAEAGQE